MTLAKVKTRSIYTLMLLSLSVLSSVMIALLWDKTNVIQGKPRSIALYTLCLFAGSIASWLMLFILPFASLFGVKQIIATTVGLGSSGLVTSLLAIIQQPSNKYPRFSFDVFFFIIAVLVLLSTVCYVLIMKMKAVQRFNIRNHDQNITIALREENNVEEEPLFDWKVVFQKSKVPVINQIYVSLMYYILMSTLPFTTRGFGEKSRQFLFLTTIFGLVSGSIGRLVTILWRCDNTTFLSALQTPMFIFIFSMSFLNTGNVPHYIGWLIIVFYSFMNLLYGLEEASNYQKISYVFNKADNIERGTMCVAFGNQAASFLGSLIGFVLTLYAY